VQSHIPLEPSHPCKEPPSGLNDIRTFMPIYVQSLAHLRVSVAKPYVTTIGTSIQRLAVVSLIPSDGNITYVKWCWSKPRCHLTKPGSSQVLRTPWRTISLSSKHHALPDFVSGKAWCLSTLHLKFCGSRRAKYGPCPGAWLQWGLRSVQGLSIFGYPWAWRANLLNWWLLWAP